MNQDIMELKMRGCCCSQIIMELGLKNLERKIRIWLPPWPDFATDYGLERPAGFSLQRFAFSIWLIRSMQESMRESSANGLKRPLNIPTVTIWQMTIR